MDNLTHSLTGLALSRAGLNRFSPHATALLILSANAPDIDILTRMRSGFAYLEAHRGYTHSFVFLPVIALVAVLVVAGVTRRRLPWRNAWLLCCLGVASHIVMDWTNSYGVRMALPFSSRWFHLDLNGLYDVWILLALVLAAIWPVFSRLVSREIGDRPPAGRGIALFALVFFVLFDGARAILHARAVAQLESRLYDEAAPLQAAALPDSFSPFRWTGIVETARDFRVVDLDALSQLNFENSQTWYKPAMAPSLESAKREEPFRFFLYFARFPVWAVHPVILDGGQPGKRVELTDLRFGTPGAGAFHCVALQDARARVLQTWFRFRSGREVGWGAGGDPGGTLVQ